MTVNLTRRLLAGLGLAVLVAPCSTHAATIVWDGTTDQNWTNGPQDTTATAYPNNGTVGANWTINAGAPGQIPAPDAGTPAGNLVDYQYSGHDWTISNATVSEDVQIKLDGGSLTVNNATLSLLPTSATTAAGLSGLNLGQNGAATTAVFTDSTINLGRSNFGGRALGVTNGSSMSLVNSDLVLTAESGNGLMDLSNPNTSFTMDADSSITASGSIEVRSPEALFTMEGGTLDIDHLRLNANGGPSTNDILFVFEGGSVTITNANGLRGNLFEGSFNWTGAAGSGNVTHTDLSNNNANLAGKIAQGFFSIDGTRINPAISNTSDWSNPANIAALNDELDDPVNVVNGRYFELTVVGGEQVLNLVPEPGTVALLALSGLLVGQRRRHV